MFSRLVFSGTLLPLALLGIVLAAHAQKVPEILSEVTLKAEAGKKAIPQVQAAFGKYSIETPAKPMGTNRKFEHLTVEKDKEMDAAFVFRIRRDMDGDRDKVWPKGQERQRNEIKGYQSSPKTMKALPGDVTRYHWYFKIHESFAVTKNFCHFFQLKPVGGKSASSPFPVRSFAGSNNSKCVGGPRTGTSACSLRTGRTAKASGLNVNVSQGWGKRGSLGCP